MELINTFSNIHFYFSDVLIFQLNIFLFRFFLYKIKFIRIFGLSFIGCFLLAATHTQQDRVGDVVGDGKQISNLIHIRTHTRTRIETHA